MPTFRFKHDTTGKGTKSIARRIDDAGEVPGPKEVEHPMTGKAHPIAEAAEVTSEGTVQEDSLHAGNATPDAESVSSELSRGDSTVAENSVETPVDSPVDGSAGESDATIAETGMPENEPGPSSDVTGVVADESLPQDSEPLSDESGRSPAPADETNRETDPKAELLSELREELLNELRVELKDELRAELKEELKAELKAKLKADLRNSLKDNLSADGHSS